MSAIRVLVVDDHAVLRDGLRNIMQMEPDIQVVGEADSGEAATLLAESLRPDVVLMDIRLPGMDGIAAARHIRSTCPQTAIIFLTMHDSDEFLFAAIREGACGYLLKALPSSEVLKAVRAAARGESLLDPAMARKLMQGYADLSRNRERPAVPAAQEAGGQALTPRETEVLKRLVEGDSNRQIAQQLFLSEKTVKQHVTKILRKLGVRSRSHAIILAIRSNLVS